MFKRAIESDPKHADSHAGLGALLFDAGKPAEAEPICRRVRLLASTHQHTSMVLRAYSSVDRTTTSSAKLTVPTFV